MKFRIYDNGLVPEDVQASSDIVDSVFDRERITEALKRVQDDWPVMDNYEA